MPIPKKSKKIPIAPSKKTKEDRCTTAFSERRARRTEAEDRSIYAICDDPSIGTTQLFSTKSGCAVVFLTHHCFEATAENSGRKLLNLA